MSLFMFCLMAGCRGPVEPAATRGSDASGADTSSTVDAQPVRDSGSDSASSGEEPGPVLSEPILDDPSADLVLLLPAVDEAALVDQWNALLPWITSRAAMGFRPAALPLYAIGEGPVTPERVRDALAEHFDDSRSSTHPLGRHLAIFGLPDGTSDPGAELPWIPRAHLDVPGTDYDVTTDWVYADPTSTMSLEAGTPTVFGDVDLADPTFLVFRMPAPDLDALSAFVDRTAAWERSAHRRDATLVAGGISGIRGDSSSLQCTVASNLAGLPTMGSVTKVFDFDVCEPDVLLSEGGERLADVLVDPARFEGGVVYVISHGSGESIVAEGDERFFSMFEVADTSRLDPQVPWVYLSLACANDEPLEGEPNLSQAILHSGGVATVTSTSSMYFVPGTVDVLELEVSALPEVMGSDATLSAAVQRVRAGYYASAAEYPEDQRYGAWINLLGSQTNGDGTIRLGPEP